MEANPPVRNIIIVGGGTAGWITAGLIAARRRGDDARPVTVTLIESPQIGTIGVGEGTWPTMRSTLQQLGIAESTFLRACSATFKQGTRFDGWRDGRPDDRYYHPFTAPAGYPGTALAPLWWRERAKLSFADAVGAQGMVCERGLAPKQSQTPEFAGVVNYAYHLDAGRFAELLTRHCTETLGVRHVQDRITAIRAPDNGDIESLETEAHGALAGDFFVDCSGMRSMLLAGHYGVGLVDCSDVLFNDTALAVQVDYADAQAPIASQTISSARSNGWIWDIGLTHRRGVGYVYSSRHGSDEHAAEMLEDYLDATGAEIGPDFAPRRISFSPGYREHFWHRNVVAVGMSSGFIEPLEASALVMVELSARAIVEDLPVDRVHMDVAARRFNDRFRYRWERIIDFLKLHYVLSRRDDSDYWRDNRLAETIPGRLRDLLALWNYRPPSPTDLPQIDEVFSAASYQYVLFGMGFAPERYRVPAGDRAVRDARALFEDNMRTANRYLSNLPPHRALLDRIARDGLPAAG